MFDSRTNISEQVVQEVRTHFPEQVFQTIIPRNVRLSEAPSHGRTILSYAPQSAGAQAYKALSAELLARVENGAAWAATTPESKAAAEALTVVRSAQS
jgi:chromosome partitioning protein